MDKEALFQNINIVWSMLIIEELLKNKIDNFFVSPGNRNVPLIFALSSSSKAVKSSCIDERASACRALGYARATGKPGVLVCTSGTALSNYYPAVIEAYRDEVPMIIISADRPLELINSDANQTINQKNIYGDFCRQFLDLPNPCTNYPVKALLSKVDHLVHDLKGPAHINCPFREPLTPDPQAPTLPDDYIKEVKGFLGNKNPYTAYCSTLSRSVDLAEVTEIISNTRRGMLVVGRLQYAEDKIEVKKEICRFAAQLGWPVHADITSSLRGEFEGLEVFSNMDHQVAVQNIERYNPETILQLGTGIVSKQYYQTIINNDARTLIQVTLKSGLRDPAHRAGFIVQAGADEFISEYQKNIKNQKTGRTDEPAFTKLKQKNQQLEDALFQKTPQDCLSMPVIAETIFQTIPDNEALFLGNSLTIRAFDALAVKLQKQLSIVTNRGVSGIEGNLSTSIGYAQGSGNPTTAVIGDITFLHDMNALSFIHECRTPIIIIVINNQGGRIFDRLPIGNFPEVAVPCVITPHNNNFKNIAGQFNIPYTDVALPADLLSEYKKALKNNQTCMIEIHLSPELDLDVHNARKAITLEK